ncbi:MAG: hypothetical protein M3Q65_24360 [Chloroflexota bacterium]|nr:hypothetical protein [Chloroflexota bacterium]
MAGLLPLLFATALLLAVLTAGLIYGVRARRQGRVPTQSRSQILAQTGAITLLWVITMHLIYNGLSFSESALLSSAFGGAVFFALSLGFQLLLNRITPDAERPARDDDPERV